MPTDFRSGYQNYSNGERVRKAAAGYGGMTDTFDKRLKAYSMRAARERMDTMGLMPDAPMIKTIQSGHSPEDI